MILTGCLELNTFRSYCIIFFNQSIEIKYELDEISFNWKKKMFSLQEFRNIWNKWIFQNHDQKLSNLKFQYSISTTTKLCNSLSIYKIRVPNFMNIVILVRKIFSCSHTLYYPCIFYWLNIDTLQYFTDFTEITQFSTYEMKDWIKHHWKLNKSFLCFKMHQNYSLGLTDCKKKNVINRPIKVNTYKNLSITL